MEKNVVEASTLDGGGGFTRMSWSPRATAASIGQEVSQAYDQELTSRRCLASIRVP